MGIDLDLVADNQIVKHLICALCTGLLDNAIMLKKCEHMFCGLCFKVYAKRTCPTCRNVFNYSDIKPVTRIVKNFLRGWSSILYKPILLQYRIYM
jgi:hypothetical protein